MKLDGRILANMTAIGNMSLLSRNVKVKIYKTIILPVVLYGCETRSLTTKGRA
jgi:hypothetical protein